MVYLAVDKDGYEKIYSSRPQRDDVYEMWFSCDGTEEIFLPEGSIMKLIGRELTWKDECVCLEN